MPLHDSPEILAPAGSPDALEAALDAGADAVYFGLRRLNARRGAANFEPDQLPQTVERIHQAGAKAYLTLNIQLVQRELGLAFRTLQCASDAHVDAVLVTDPALLAAAPHFPRLDFHFSTQAGISSSAGVKAARELGLTRVVVARELSRDELAACTACGGIEIEAFVQGAHCFSCSGHCLLSSWGGGRSGNRGACTSPCRVCWRNRQGTAANPLSMHDMSLLHDILELRDLGIASLKIEGRLKSPAWVREAVSLYRQALDKNSPDGLEARVARLGDYSGRQQSDGFFQGHRDHLTGSSARPAANAIPKDDDAPDEPAKPTLRASITTDERDATLVTLTLGTAQDTLRLPKQRIANPSRALPWQEAANALADALPHGQQPPVIDFQPPELAEQLVPRNFRKHLADFAGRFCRQCAKTTDGIVRTEGGLPTPVADLLRPRQTPCPDNRLTLGSRPTHLRLDATQARNLTARDLADAGLDHCDLILDLAPQTPDEAETLARLALSLSERLAAVALPDVVYEAQLPALTRLLDLLADTVPAFEVNSWDTWQLAHNRDVPLWAGPGFGVLNAVAATHLARLGCTRVTVSPEIDQEQLQELCAAATVPLSLTVFSHLRLMVTRAQLPEGFAPEDDARLEDARHTVLEPRREGAVTALRSAVPLDWRQLRNPDVKVAMLVLDAIGAPALPGRHTPDAKASLFNYDRRLR